MHEKLPLVFATLKLYWISLSLDSRGNFLVLFVVNFKKSKGKSKNNSEFASLIKLFYSLRSIQEQISAWNLRFLRLKRTKKCFSEGLGANFDSSLVDTRSMHLSKVKIPLYFALICVFWAVFCFSLWDLCFLGKGS